jgi:hypothetical protein
MGMNKGSKIKENKHWKKEGFRARGGQASKDIRNQENR